MDVMGASSFYQECTRFVFLFRKKSRNFDPSTLTSLHDCFDHNLFANGLIFESRPISISYQVWGEFSDVMGASSFYQEPRIYVLDVFMMCLSQWLAKYSSFSERWNITLANISVDLTILNVVGSVLYYAKQTIKLL